ncbi:MAG: PQQ-binding-like beta-propeller repeat protein [Chthoniobacteraceae bacterium]
MIRFLSFALLATSAPAIDWPHFRGPARDGISAEKAWRSEWPGDVPVAWKAEVGLGYSSIVVAKGRAATVGHADAKDTIFCFDATTGKSLWTHSHPSELGDKYYEGGTTGTPTFDGDRLYWLSRWGDLMCLDAATGKALWEKNIAKETGAPIPTWGYTGAPLVHGDLLVLNVGDAGTAVEKATGKLVWKSAAKDAGYSTPLPRGELALLANTEHYLAVDMKTGAEAWRFRWLTQYGVNAADPIVSGDRVFISSGYGKGAALLKLGGAAPEQLWKSKKLRTQLNAAVLHDGHLYGVDGDTTEKAPLKCLDFATGDEKWSEPGFGSGGVIIADGKLIALSGVGELMIAPASPAGFKPTTRAQVFGPKSWTAPVLANGLLYCRNNRGELVVLDLRAR